MSSSGATGVDPAGKVLLWMDDKPSNNEAVVRAAQGAGVQVVVATSQVDAESVFQELVWVHKVDASNPARFRVISDMHQDKNEGLPTRNAAEAILQSMRGMRVTGVRMLVYCNFLLPQAQELATKYPDNLTATRDPNVALRFATFEQS